MPRLFLVCLVLTIFCSCASAQRPVGNLVIADRPIAAEITYYEVHFVSRNFDEEISLVVRREADGIISAKLTVAGETWEELKLPVERVPNLDFSTIFVGEVSLERQNQERGAISIDIRFGDSTDCFANDDGRSFVSFLFRRNGAHAIMVTTFRDCHSATEEVVL